MPFRFGGDAVHVYLTINTYKTELVWRRRPFADLKELELATFRWVSWWNSKRLYQSLGYKMPEAVETEYYANQEMQVVSL